MLENTFADWINTHARPKWEVVGQEIANRTDIYPSLQSYLTKRPVDAAGFAALAGKCVVMTIISSYASTPAKTLFADPHLPSRIGGLIDYLPESSDEIARRIDRFVDEVAEPTGLKPIYVAAIASLFLTVAHPRRVVDFPTLASWTGFAQELGYGVPPSGASYGQRIVWASAFAAEVAQSETFRRQWKGVHHPMWIVSGLNWTHKRLKDEA